MGNLRSVQKAFEHVGAGAMILSDPAQVRQMDRLVLPGVGAFGDGMRQLHQANWAQAIEDFLDTGKPFLGICLGMQLLFTCSQEDAPSPQQPVAGLGVLSGQIVRFKTPTAGGPRFKVPHMGWNTLTLRSDDSLLRDLPPSPELPPDPAVYFVHSYYAVPDDPEIISATTEYPRGNSCCAAIHSRNIWGTQFHPEKSQRVGLKMLANFTAL